MAKKHKRPAKATKTPPEPAVEPAVDVTAEPEVELPLATEDALEDDELEPEAPPEDGDIAYHPPAPVPPLEPALEESYDKDQGLRGSGGAVFDSVVFGEADIGGVEEKEVVEEEEMQEIGLEEAAEEGQGGDISLDDSPPTPWLSDDPPAPDNPVEVEEAVEESLDTIEENSIEEDSLPLAEREVSEGSTTSTGTASTALPRTPSLNGSAPTDSPSTTPASSKVALPASTQPIIPSIGIPIAVVAPPIPSSPTERRGSVDKHLQSPSKGASIMQKVMSMTRQRDLPPKPKDEERKHLRELDEMLAASKEAEIRRAAQAELASNARAAVLAAALPTWETAILPNWRSVLRPDEEGASLRRLWWEGTMPVRWRGRLWGMTVGNGLAVSRSAYGTARARAKTGIEEGRYPEGVMEQLLEEVQDTLPALKMFQKGGVMHDDLVDVLLAYSVYGSGPPRHPRGISFAAAMLLVNMNPPDAFLSLLNLVNKSCLKSFYSEDTRELDAYHRIFDTLLADTMPKVYANFSQEVVRPSLYLDPWLTTLFVRYLPPDLAFRIFDVFFLEGDSILFRVALVLLQLLEPRLFNPNLDELSAVFKGTDRGAVAIVRRENGGEERVGVDDVYGIMGVSEESVFGLLDRLDWKEETWDRLVARELPEAD